MFAVLLCSVYTFACFQKIYNPTANVLYFAKSDKIIHLWSSFLKALFRMSPAREKAIPECLYSETLVTPVMIMVQPCLMTESQMALSGNAHPRQMQYAVRYLISITNATGNSWSERLCYTDVTKLRGQHFPRNCSLKTGNIVLLI